MSDYGQQQYAYDDYQIQDQMQIEEDYETKLQLQYFQAQQMLRKNQTQTCISSLQQIYKIAEQHQLKNWKVKILNLLLQIYCKANLNQKIKQTLKNISNLNKKQKYTESSIKSIIMTIKALSKQSFNFNKDLVYEFINQLDIIGKIRSYLLFLQKVIEQQNQQQTQKLFKLIDNLIFQSKQQSNQTIPSGNLIQLYSLRIKYNKSIGKDISNDIKGIYLKLPSLEAQSYMSQGHISIIKQAISEILYSEDNFVNCALNLCECFQENVKYGKSTQNKKYIIKINLFVCLLTNNKEIYTNQKYCVLYNEAASSFKGQNDIQSLFGIVEAFQNVDIKRFIQQSKMCNLKFTQPYQNLLQKALFLLKKNKLLQIVKAYQKIKVSYLQSRLNSSTQQILKMIIQLIADRKINGRIKKINKQNMSQIILQIKNNSDEYLNLKLENIRQLSKKLK